MTRRNDLDGRGHLSEENLAEFTKFFLTTCLDQVTFMEGLVQPDQLRTRIMLWAEEEIRLDPARKVRPFSKPSSIVANCRAPMLPNSLAPARDRQAASSPP